jgi:thiamine-monophosphate kinase
MGRLSPKLVKPKNVCGIIKIMENKVAFTSIANLGEFGLIDHLTKNFSAKNPQVIKSVGDDCAVIDTGNPTHYQLITTDILTEGIHFDVVYTPLKHLGYKAVVANVSDIYAMNGTPQYITVSIAISSKYSVEAVEEIYKGMYLACERYGIDLIGGDTTSSLKGLFISITAIGTIEKEKVAYRSGAKENDLICVSGDLGAAFMGLQLLEREKRVFKEHPGVQPDLENQHYLLARQLKPEARKDIIGILAIRKIVPTSMIDISDGLSSEITHLCKQSNCGARLYESKIPIHSDTFELGVNMNLDIISVLMNGGEDYELLFTVSQKDYEQLKEESDISIIGHMTSSDQGIQMMSKGGQLIDIKAKGWSSFKESESSAS